MSTDINLAVCTQPNFIDKTHNDYLQERKIIINDEVNSDLVETAILQIIRWNEIDAENNTPIEKRQKITIYLNTSGGEIATGFCLANVIEASQTPIEIIVLGTCASMGIYICISASKWGMRKCYNFSTFLMHSGSMFVGGTSNAVASTVSYYNELEKSIAQFVYKHTKITPAMYRKKSKDEFYFGSKESKKLGVIDSIIGEE